MILRKLNDLPTLLVNLLNNLILIGKITPRKAFLPIWGLVSACRKLWLNGPENTYEDNFTLENTPDNVIAAILWTLLLIACLILWPLILCQLVYWMIFKPDMTEFEEMFK